MDDWGGKYIRSHPDENMQTFIIEPGEFMVPPIDQRKYPGIKSHYKEFVFTFDYSETGGLKGKFRFLIPLANNGNLVYGKAIDDRFKIFIDPDGDLCLTAPSYEDKRLNTDFIKTKDDDYWGAAEIRGIYRDRYGLKPSASESEFDEVLEVVKSSYRWAQDGLYVGPLDKLDEKQESDQNSATKSERDIAREAKLFDLVYVPGLNAADIDIRGNWRVGLSVRRTEIQYETIENFVDKYYQLAAQMWKSILDQSGMKRQQPEYKELVHWLLDQANWRLKPYFQKAFGTKSN
jgi:hypothetical protein